MDTKKSRQNKPLFTIVRVVLAGMALRRHLRNEVKSDMHTTYTQQQLEQQLPTRAHFHHLTPFNMQHQHLPFTFTFPSVHPTSHPVTKSLPHIDTFHHSIYCPGIPSLRFLYLLSG